MLYYQGVQSPGPTANPGAEQTVCMKNFMLVLGDGSKYLFPNASIYCIKSIPKSNSCYSYDFNWCPMENIYDPYHDALLDYDYGSDQEDGYITQGQGLGQDILLDLTQANSNTGYAVVRFRDGSQIKFPLGVGYSDPKITGSQNLPVPDPPTGQWSSIASAIVDTNGNSISMSQNGNTLTWTDSLGRTVSWINNSIQYRDSNGTLETIQLNYSNFNNSVPMPTFLTPVPDNKNIYAGGVTPINSVLSSVVLPDGLSYTFQYDSYGEIIKITYPSGGYSR